MSAARMGGRRADMLKLLIEEKASLALAECAKEKS